MHKPLHQKQSQGFPGALQDGSHKEGQWEGPRCHQWGGEVHIPHLQVHPWSGLQEVCSLVLRKVHKLALKEMETPDVCIDARLSKAFWATGVRNVPCLIHVSCPENVLRMRIGLKSSVLWFPMQLSPLSKIYSQCEWELNKVLSLPKQTQGASLADSDF